MNNDKQIAQTILQQLGGNKFLAMTGSYNLAIAHSGLVMRLRRNKLQATFLKITLNSMDLYDVEFIKMIKYESKIVKSFSGVYNDMLVNIFEKETGLYTSL